ncbi:glycoside hydrolase family 5 protein [Vararia minispora EC-137]|uniref:Glycoside hydrolase family 5 protein n=1 Tax=Vararia minispora EC-137 TaxID=1314806 RepID=A0ACB8Q4S4_9AGAM|nr:glycoside hydrolase family 5 protein [Vararia minispora EC-137]
MLFLHTLLLTVFAAPQVSFAKTQGKIYGLNIGGWLLSEPWMNPAEWLAMGGQQCNACSACIASEWAFVRAYPDTADATFAKHWATWFTKDDVTKIKDLGMNTVRIPLGYWLVEALVDRSTEFYPRGGIKYLTEALGWLKDAGIQVLLDHHALPGAQTSGQQFAGNCTNDPQFYTPYNYHRALIWTAAMTAVTHLHPNYESVFALEAVNEPFQDANRTPGYGDFQKAFVETVRLMELVLGVYSPDQYAKFGFSTSDLVSILADLEGSDFASASANISLSLRDLSAVDSRIFSPNATLAVAEALPIVLEIAKELGMGHIGTWGKFKGKGGPLETTFMDVTWQYTGPAANPADAAIGPQIYDNHLYYSFGGVADPNPDAYLRSMCNLNRLQVDEGLGDTPLVFGEWSVAINFAQTDEFLSIWADAQKMSYSQGAGWIFWNFKIEDSSYTSALVDQWSYYKAIEKGYTTKDPSQYNNASVCDAYRNVATATSSAALDVIATSASSAASSSTGATPTASTAPASATSVLLTASSSPAASTSANSTSTN